MRRQRDRPAATLTIGRRRTRTMSAVAAVAALVTAGASIAVTTSLATPAGAATQTFTSNGTFTVPAGVTSLSIVLTGASGGDCGSHLQGRGAVVQATLPVTSGSTLNIFLGTYGGGIGGAGGTDGAPAGQTANGGPVPLSTTRHPAVPVEARPRTSGWAARP